MAEEKKQEAKVPMLQRIIITLADGRQGAFAGPVLVSETELTLKLPQITNIAFTPPQPLQVPKPPDPKTLKEKDDAPKADQKGIK